MDDNFKWRLMDIRAHEYNSVVKNGISSVSEGKVVIYKNLPACIVHGHLICVSKTKNFSIWRCIDCNEGCIREIIL